MASFMAKIGWKRVKNIENKNYRFVSFLPDAQQKIPKKQQNFQKIQKHHYDFISGQNSLEKVEKVRK